MQDLSRWLNPDCPVEVEYSPQVVEEIRLQAVEGLVALRRTGLGIGGLLLGARVVGGGIGPNLIRIVALESIECTHALGPGFVLSPLELNALRKRLQQKNSLAVVGLYLSKPRGELNLTEQQAALVNELFSEPFQVTLLIRPGSMEPSAAVLYFWSGGLLKRGTEWEIQPWHTEKRASRKADTSSAKPVEQNLGNPVFQTPAIAAGKMEALSLSEATGQMVSEAAAPGGFHPAPTTVPVASVTAPEVPSGFSPTPIAIKFDSTPLSPREPGDKVLSSMERFYLKIRMNLSKILAAAAVMVLLMGIAAGVYYSRPLWYKPPAANLTITDSNGTLTFHWNPASAEYVDAGTLSVLDGGERRTVALTHEDLMTGKADFIRTTGHVTASLALDDRRFLASFNEPAQTKTASSNPAPTGEIAPKAVRRRKKSPPLAQDPAPAERP